MEHRRKQMADMDQASADGPASQSEDTICPPCSAEKTWNPFFFLFFLATCAFGEFLVCLRETNPFTVFFENVNHEVAGEGLWG